MFGARDAVDIPVYKWDVGMTGRGWEDFSVLDENGAKAGKARYRVEYLEKLFWFVCFRDGLKAGYIK